MQVRTQKILIRYLQGGFFFPPYRWSDTRSRPGGWGIFILGDIYNSTGADTEQPDSRDALLKAGQITPRSPSQPKI